MIELHLIGYTAELGHLVVDLVGGDTGRYRLRVDEDLFATLDELRERRRERGLAVGDLVEFADELGLTRDRLQALQDADARADAAAGRVSTGTAAAEQLLPPSSEDPDEPVAVPATPADDAPTSPTVLPGWEDEASHDHVDGDPVVFAPSRDAPTPRDHPAPEPGPEVTPPPGRVPEPPPDSSASDADEAAVRIVPAPPREPAPDESDGLVARALASHGLTPEAPPTPSEPEPADEDQPDPTSDPGPPAAAPAPIEVPDPVHGRTPPRPLVAAPVGHDRDGRARHREPVVEPEVDRRPAPVLSPAEIQSRLRSGRSVRAVARAAGVDEERIRRWEVPIVAERARILDQARGLRLERPRLGRSSQPLGEAVRRNLASRGVTGDDVAWETSRRRDGRWRVCVRYVSRGRRRSATWTYDPEAGELRAASDSARELGFVRRRR